MTNAIIIIAATIFFEAAGEPYKGKEAVATVIYNRAANRDMSLVRVCKQPYQFSCWNRKRHAKEIDFKSKAWDDCHRLSSMLVCGEFDPLDDWNHYYNPDLANPSWGKKMQNTRKIGNHLFGTL